MNQLLGIAGLILVIALVATCLSYDPVSGNFPYLPAYNLKNLRRRVGMFGVLSTAVASEKILRRCAAYRGRRSRLRAHYESSAISRHRMLIAAG